MGNLTEARVRKAKHSGRTRFHERISDGGTLFLQLAPTGAKCWVQVVQVRGRRHTVGLGGHPLTSLQEARDAAYENRRAARRGIPPAKRRGRGPGAPTFAEAAEEVVATQARTWRAGGKSEAQWRSSLAAYAHPVLGRMRVGDVTSADVVAVLKPIWTAKRETARRVKHRISKVMDWAVVHGHRTDNPCQAVEAALPRMGARPRHHRALPYAEVPAAVAAVRASAAWRGAKLAFEFLVLTAARSGEVRLATWGEVDVEAGVWTVPGERMKMGREHRVPLSVRCVDVLREAGGAPKGSRAGVPQCAGQGALGRHDEPAAARTRDRRGAARLPILVPRLGGGQDGRAAGGGGGSAGAQGAERRRGGLRPHRPLRAPQGADGRLGRVPVRIGRPPDTATVHDRLL